MSDKGKLTQAEADRLLNMLKTSLSSNVTFPARNNSIEFDVQGDTKQDVFTIKIFRGKIKSNKCNYGARIKKDGILLLELHINPSNPHANPDGEKIIGSHWHIYREGYDRKFAFPATEVDDDNFVDNTILFFKKFNIIKPPSVTYQLELLP